MVDGGDYVSFTAVFNATAANPMSDVAAPPAADPGKWNCRSQDLRFYGAELTNVSFDRIGVLLFLNDPGPEPGPDELNYTNAPSDITDAGGRKLAAFSGFPL